MNSFPITTRARETPPFAFPEMTFVNIPTCAHETPTLRQAQKRGRPRKDIDVGVMFHMLKNSAPLAVVARHLGVSRDTLYANFPNLIKEAYASHRATWRKIAEESFAKWLEAKKLKDEAKRIKSIKRRYRRKNYYRMR